MWQKVQEPISFLLVERMQSMTAAAESPLLDSVVARIAVLPHQVDRLRPPVAASQLGPTRRNQQHLNQPLRTAKLGVPDIHWTEVQSLCSPATLDSKLNFSVKFMIEMQEICSANSITDGHDSRLDHWRCAVAWTPIDVGWRT